MSDRLLTDAEAREVLRKAIGPKRGDIGAFAQKVGVSGAMISILLAGRRPIPAWLAAEIGLKKISGWTIDNGKHSA